MHRILVIGTGSIGERHVRCFLATERAQVAICEVKPALRSAVAGRYGLLGAYAQLEEALEASWDAAVVCTPANTHIPIARTLAARGVHVLLEKPLSTSTGGVADLIECVADRGLIAGVAYVYRAHPVLAAMRDRILAGDFGPPRQVVVTAGQHFPTARPAYREIYYARRASGGGAIQDALTHLINAAEWIVGPITRLAANAGRLSLEGVEVEDTVHLIARHGPVMASYSLNQHQPADEVALTVVCASGMARFELIENRWRWMREPRGQWTDEAGPPMERDDWFIRQANWFLDALEGQAAPLCTLADALQTLRVNIAALDSADRSGMPVDIRA